ncbi:MAG: hypothetical protein ABI488_15665 [Polyangiaceae bacterium]
MGRLFDGLGFTHAGYAGAHPRELLFQRRDRFLLFEHDLVQLRELALQVGVANFEIDDARVHEAL